MLQWSDVRELEMGHLGATRTVGSVGDVRAMQSRLGSSASV